MKSRVMASSSKLHKSRSAERVLALLDTVVTTGAVNLSDAAGALGMPASTALRHLRVLTERGYLVKDGLGLYSVGPTFVRIALAAFQAGPYARLIAAAQPRLERLAAITEESAYLAVRDGTEAVYIATVESPRAIRHVGWVGRSVPVEGTAVGEALCSAGAGDGVVPVPVPVPVYVNTGAIEPDVTAVVAPIYGSTGVAGAFSVLGPAERLIDERRELASDAVAQLAGATSLALSSPEAVAVGIDAGDSSPEST